MTNIKSVTPVGKAQTYDLEVAHPDHQYYLSNGMLTSNSHATLYSMISLHTGYLKANYPIEFLVANLISEVKSNAKQAKDNILKIKTELRNRKVKIVPPDINTSGLSWKIKDEHTLMTGLDSLKYMGGDAIPELIAKRPFVSFQDLVYRTESRKVRSPSIQSMAASGSLDSFELERHLMFYYASDFRAKLRAHMEKLDRKIIREWSKENNYSKAKDDVGNEFWVAEESPDELIDPPKPTEQDKAEWLAEFKYPFPEEGTIVEGKDGPVEIRKWTIQEQFAMEDYYMGEGISGTIFDRYPDFFHPKRTVPFAALKEMFPWKHHSDDERTNRKANTHYLGNQKIRPLEAVITSMFVFTVKKEDSPIFGQEMARITLQDPWGDDASLLCFPEAWEMMKQRIERELSGGKQAVEPGVAIRFLGSFQWENEASTSFVLSDILAYKAPPSMPEDRASRKVKMPRANKLKAEEASTLDQGDLLERLENEMLDDGYSFINDPTDDDIES